MRHWGSAFWSRTAPWAELYHGEVQYARGAFEGLRLMDAVMAGKRGGAPIVDSAGAARTAERKARRERSLRIAAARRAREVDEPVAGRSDVATDVPVSTQPFWGT